MLSLRLQRKGYDVLVAADGAVAPLRDFRLPSTFRAGLLTLVTNAVAFSHLGSQYEASAGARSDTCEQEEKTRKAGVDFTGLQTPVAMDKEEVRAKSYTPPREGRKLLAGVLFPGSWSAA